MNLIYKSIKVLRNNLEHMVEYKVEYTWITEDKYTWLLQRYKNNNTAKLKKIMRALMLSSNSRMQRSHFG